MNPYALTFCCAISLVILFQLALALGAPWGKIAMGGKYPGKFPAPIRIAALIQAGVLLFFGWVILVYTGFTGKEWKEFSGVAVWFVFGFSIMATILNLITPSKWERIIWAPVCLILLFSVAMILVNG